MSTEPEKRLSPRETIELYCKGPEVWNRFIEKYDSVYFDFTKCDWGGFRVQLERLQDAQKFGRDVISFKGYMFKAGTVDFTGTDFGAKLVDFSDLELNDTSLILADTKCYGTSFNLSGLKIKKGNLNLQGIKLGLESSKTVLSAAYISLEDGNFICSDAVLRVMDANFSHLTIRNGSVDFSGTKFGDGDFSLFKSHICGDDFDFISCVFGKGKKDLSQSIFDVSRVCFSGTNFSDGIVSFSACDFSKVSNWVHFQDVISRGYSLIFMGSMCAKIEFDFSGSVFENKIIDFSGLDFANGNYNFDSCEFHGRVSFSDEEENTSTAQSLSFRKSIFHSTLDISGINTASIIDLRETKLSTHTTLDNLGFKLARSKSIWFIPGTLKATSKDDASKLRRLKEIAETNKNHTAALRFHAAEMRARRWHDMPKLASILDAAFSLTSNYGQSILRPFVAWLFVVCGAGSVYSGMFNKLFSELTFSEMYSQADFGNGFLYSLIQTLPVFPISRVLQQDLYLLLSNQMSAEWLSGLTIFQNLLGGIFLFLIGLGLRNRFRL